MQGNDTRKNKTIGLMKKTIAVMLSVIFAALPLFSFSSYAATDWPYPGGDIQAGSAVVMDADTLTVLWGRNQDEQQYPASITKMMTALVVAEHCSMDEKVPVTANAVYNLESGATTAGLSVDDILTVEDLLYALLLKSANDAANALAIYVAGSISDFAVMMNEKAAELGCKNTDFKNPSGLTDSEHLTTAYDMALIAAEFVKNESLLEIESHDSYKLPATQKNPSGFTVTMGHKMLRSGTAYSDDRVIAGKTGFTTASGNTLVTVAEQDGRRVVVVCMKDKTPYHYSDTRTLMEFGFNSFENLVIGDPINQFNCSKRLETDTILSGGDIDLSADDVLRVTLPKGADTNDITASFDYNVGADAPDMAKAKLKLYYADRCVGSTWIINNNVSKLEFEGVSDNASDGSLSLGLIIIVIAAVLAAAVAAVVVHAHKTEEKRKRRFRERQKRRLSSMGISQDEFDRLVSRKSVTGETVSRIEHSGRHRETLRRRPRSTDEE